MTVIVTCDLEHQPPEDGENTDWLSEQDEFLTHAFHGDDAGKVVNEAIAFFKNTISAMKEKFSLEQIYTKAGGKPTKNESLVDWYSWWIYDNEERGLKISIFIRPASETTLLSS